MAIQLTRTGRRVLRLAHESAPKCVTADERTVVHTVDRFTGGLYVLELKV